MNGLTRARLQKMIRHCNDIERTVGLAHANRARESLLVCLDMALEAEELWPDGDLGLGGKLPGGIVFGIVPHYSGDPDDALRPVLWTAHS